MTAKPIELLLSDARPDLAPIVLSEGDDPRIVEGALAAVSQGLAKVILVGNAAQVRGHLARLGATESDRIAVHDPADSPLHAELADDFHALRKHKGIDELKARAAVQDRLTYAAMLVRRGYAAGTVGGAVETTSDVVRAALQVIGKAPDAALVSSFFLMYPPDNAGTDARPMLYSDCGLVIDPSAQDMAAIAADAARSFAALMQDSPRIALLSFSTRGSARHPAVSKVSEAAALLSEAHPELACDGELQFDAAFDPAVGAKKASGSDVAGRANVMIFPNLDAGNIAYKITQRLAGYTAIGPVLQGLAKPANDLSRGCTASDVTEMIAVTVLQAANE